MRTARLPRLVARLVAVVLAADAAAAVDAASANRPGAYCPLPEKGEIPRCLAPARATYDEFFSALDGDAALDGAVSAVEQAVAQGAGGEEAYLALSSLTYGYFRLAQRAATNESADPGVTSRLTRWNALLARAYAESPDDPRYRAAVRLAAEELHDRARISVPCGNPEGEASDCNSTESVLRSFNAANERVGIRGALERLLRRLLGREGT